MSDRMAALQAARGPRGPRRPRIKLSLVGEATVGKSTLITVLRGAPFPDPTKLPRSGHYENCQKFDKTVRGHDISVELWDNSAEQDSRQRSINGKKASTNVAAVAVCFSLADKATFETVVDRKRPGTAETKMTWAEEVRSYPLVDGELVFLIGTKSDLPRDPAITDAEIERVKKALGASAFVAVSSNKPETLDRLVETAADHIDKKHHDRCSHQ